MRAFFEQTRAATVDISEVFNFIWVAVPALWNLRWQVRGFLSENPDTSGDDLKARFVSGSGVIGSNVRRACVDTAWEEQKDKFATVIVSNVFAIYEHWAESMIAALRAPNVTGKHFQFPDDGARDGLQAVVARLTSVESKTLKRAYYPVLVNNAKYGWPNVNAYLLCYRYFKEARNSLFHAGGFATRKAEQASLAFAPLNSAAALGLKATLEIDALVEGQRVGLHPRGVVGFCDVLLRLMYSVDAELARSHYAERAFEKMLQKSVNRAGRNRLPPDVLRRNARVIRRCNAVGLPRPNDPGAVYAFMLQKGLVQ